jgi:hypothetical protein
VLVRVPGSIERFFEPASRSLRRVAEIRVRLLQETRERERREAQAFGVELLDRLSKPFALMLRLADNRCRRFGVQLGADCVEKGKQGGFISVGHGKGGKS